MALEKPIIKAKAASSSTFEYKPRDLGTVTTDVAQSFVGDKAFRSNDFKISELIAKQAGISQLERDAHQDKVNAQVLEALKEVEERGYREGHDLGLIEGTEKAFQEIKQSMMERLNTLEAVLKRIEDLKSQLLIENEEALVKLVYLVAKKIALRDLEENREAVAEIIKTVVGEIQADESVVVRLSPEDLYFVETLQDKTGKRIESLKRIKFIDDDQIKSGGCMIESQYGTVDATVEERVERTWQTLAERIPHNKSKPAGE